MKLNQEGVEKAARAIRDLLIVDPAPVDVAAGAALTAYFDHLKQEGLMYEAQYNARYHVTNEGTFIISTDKE